jgi:hypothetical protein
MKSRIPYLFSGVVSLLLLDPRPCLAIPIHGNPHGFFIHQAAHLLMTAAMIFFIYTLKREGLLQQRGFRILAWAGAILGLWSFEHYWGHFSEIWLVNPLILGQGFSQRLVMENFNAWVYYFSHLDNWLLAIFFYVLYRALKTLAQEPPGARP